MLQTPRLIHRWCVRKFWPTFKKVFGMGLAGLRTTCVYYVGACRPSRVRTTLIKTTQKPGFQSPIELIPQGKRGVFENLNMNLWNRTILWDPNSLQLCLTMKIDDESSLSFYEEVDIEAEANSLSFVILPVSGHLITPVVKYFVLVLLSPARDHFLFCNRLPKQKSNVDRNLQWQFSHVRE